MKTPEKRIAEAYRALLEAFGPQGWWPADSSFEMAVGAILTQNTAWRNAELALARLASGRILTPSGVLSVTRRQLEKLVRPAGFPGRKARTIRGLAAAVSGTEDGWRKFLEFDGERMRNELLAVWGIGRETADAIGLYAGGYPVFVVDEYAKRFAVRHGLARPEARYEQLQTLFAASLEPDTSVFGEYHALLVRLGKEFCRATPRCARCPLREDLPDEKKPPAN